MAKASPRRLVAPVLDDMADTESSCRHCRLVLAELSQCQPLTASPDDWGMIPSWGAGSLFPQDHPLNLVGSCPCSCHAAWRVLTGLRLDSPHVSPPPDPGLDEAHYPA